MFKSSQNFVDCSRSYPYLEAVEEVLHVPLVVAGHVEGLVHWRDVEHDELVDVYGPVQGGHHDSAAAHAVPSQAHTAQIQLTGNKLRKNTFRQNYTTDR